MKCSQCEKTAIYNLNNIPLCLNCLERVKAIQQQELENNMQLANIAAAHLDMALPFGMKTPRFTIPKRVQVNGPKMTNINISGGNIGVVNTGTVQRIDASINTIKSEGNAEVAHAIAELTEAIASLEKISDEDRSKALELLSAVADEAEQPVNKRRSAVLKPILEGLATVLQTGAATADLWTKFGPIITNFFNA